MSRKALGRGLSALLSEDAPIPQPPAPSPAAQTQIPVDRIHPNRFQPRHQIDSQTLQELSDSIKERGVLQPIVVSYDPGSDEYELIAGHRRLEASKLLGLDNIPAVIQDVDDAGRLEIGLIENIQREDLNPIEEALAYRMLIEKFKLTQEQVGQRLGKRRTTVANTLRLLQLPEDIQAEIATGSLSAGHAKALASIEDEDLLRQAIRHLREGTFTVRQTEAWVREVKEKPARKKKRRGVASHTDPHLADLEDALRELLGTRVRIVTGKGPRGRIEIEYYNDEDLQRVLDIIGITLD